MHAGLFRRRFSYLVVLVLAAAAFVAGNVLTERAPVRAQGSTPDAALAGPAAAPNGRWFCTISAVGVSENGLELSCAESPAGPGGPTKFMAPTISTAEAGRANRFLSILLTARASGVTSLMIQWADSASLNPPGCEPAFCRLLEAVWLD